MEPLGTSSFAATLSNLPTSLTQALPSVWKRATPDASQFDRSPDRDAPLPRSSGYSASNVSSPVNLPSQPSRHGRGSFTSLSSADAHVVSAADASLEVPGSPAPIHASDGLHPSDEGSDAEQLLSFLRIMRTTSFIDLEASLSQLVRENGALRSSLAAEARDADALRRDVAHVQGQLDQLISVNERLRKDNERLQAQLYEWRMDRWDVAVSATPPVVPPAPAAPVPLQPSTEALPMSAAAEFMTTSTAAAIARARQALPALPTLQSFNIPASVSGMLPSWASPSRDDVVPDTVQVHAGDVTPPMAQPQPTTKAAIARVLELVDAAQACLTTTSDDSHASACVNEVTVARMEDVLLALCLVSDQLHFALSARVSLMKPFDSNAPMSSHTTSDASVAHAEQHADAGTSLLLATPVDATPDATGLLPAINVPSPVAHDVDGVIPSPAAFDAMKRLAQDAVRRASLTVPSAPSPRPSQQAGVVLMDAAYPPGARIPAMQSMTSVEGRNRSPLAMLPLEASPLHIRFTMDETSVVPTFCPLEVLQGQPHLTVVSPPSDAPAPLASVPLAAGHSITVGDAASRADEPAATSAQDMSATLTVHALEKVAADAVLDAHAAAAALPPAGSLPAASFVAAEGSSGSQQQESSSAPSWSLESLRLPPKLARRLRAAQRTSSGLPHPLLNSFGPGRGLRILCLDGGGIRGLLMLECLKKLEADCGHRVVDMFDLVCGTSTGGFLSVALSMRKSLEEIAHEYERIRSTFGGQSSILSEVKRFATGTSHDHLIAEQALAAFFGPAKMNELPISPKVAVVCAAVNFTPAQPYLFRSYELTQEAFASAEILGTSNVSAATAVRATTSAPTYYAPAIIGTERMVDGAIIANNPALIALSEAALLWPGARVDALVSLGTGTQSLRPNTAASVMTWVRTVLELSLSSHVTHKLTSTLLGDRYFRFDPETAGDVDLVEVRLDVLARMLEEGRRYIHRMQPEFARLKSILVS